MKAQIGVEYMLVIGFVTAAIISVLILAYTYSGIARDSLIINQVESFAKKVVSSAETVFYTGEPSQSTITAYLPSNIINITISNYDLIIEYYISSGTVKQAYSSKVPLHGSISTTPGTKKIILRAESDRVVIS